MNSIYHSLIIILIWSSEVCVLNTYVSVQDESTLLTEIKNCIHGPSVCCRNFATALELHLVKYCIEEVWSKMETVDEKSCSSCEKKITYLKTSIDSNKKKEFVEEIRIHICDQNIFLKVLHKQCVNEVYIYIPNYIDSLLSNLDSQTVCKLLELCESKNVFPEAASKHIHSISATVKFSNVALHFPSSKHFTEEVSGQVIEKVVSFSNYDSCTNCTAAFSAYMQFMNKAPKLEVVKRILAVCEELNLYSNLCSSLVLQNYDDVFAMLTSFQPLVGCQVNGMCSKKNIQLKTESDIFRDVNTIVSTMNTFVSCDLCKQIITNFKTLVANTSLDNFYQNLLSICKQTGQFQDECTKLAHSTFHIMYQYLTVELNESNICIVIQICPRTVGFLANKNANIYQITNLFPYVSSEQSNNSILCVLCQNILHYLQIVVEDPKVKEKLVFEITKVCLLVSVEARKECDQFISQYSDLIISVFAQEIDPSLVCPALKICPSITSDRCGDCRTLMAGLIGNLTLDSDHDKSEIRSAVAKFKPVQDDMKAQIAVELKLLHSEDIIHMISAKFSAEESCTYIKFCNVKQFEILSPSVSSSSNEFFVAKSKPSCYICQMVVRVHRKELLFGNTEEIRNKLSKFCNSFRRMDFLTECSILVSEYIPKLINFISDGVESKDFCGALKLCLV